MKAVPTSETAAEKKEEGEIAEKSVSTQHDEEKDAAAKREEGKDTEEKKVKVVEPMNWGELLSLTKPFFWPAAGQPNTTVNRIRSSATWFSVAAGRVCNLYAPFFIEQATNELLAGKIDDAVISVVAYVMMRVAASGLKELQGALYVGVNQAAAVELTLKTFEHVHSLSLSWHLSKKTGGVMKSMDRGVMAVNTLVRMLFLNLFPTVAEALAIVILFSVQFEQSGIALIILAGVFMYFFVTIRITMWRKKFREKQNKYDNDFHDKAQDSIINFETVKYFTAEKYEADRYLKSVMKYEANQANTTSSMVLLNFIQQVILNATLLGALILCAQAVHEGKMTVGGWVAVMAWIQQIFAPLNFLGSIYSMVVQSLIDVRNLTELLKELPDIVDSPDATDIPFFAEAEARRLEGSVRSERSGTILDIIMGGSSGKASPGRSKSSSKSSLDDTHDAGAVVRMEKGEKIGGGSYRDLSQGVGVQLRNVSFHYPTQPKDKGLKDVTFDMPAGSTTAIVGGTGAGKTTVSRLLFRFYDPVSGAVMIDGHNIHNATQRSVRNMIGIVPQDTVLFNDSIRYNVRYGRQDATDDEVEQAAESAQIGEFIRSLPEGWDTVVGERGLKLSGGEKQRVAIARCLLKNPPIVVLDEATSALDTVTENSVQEALDTLGSNRTVLIIAHRLSTIKHADQIVAMDHGRVMEIGTHEQLCDKEGGIYAKLWAMQQRSSSSTENLVSLDAEAVTEVLQAEPVA